jgi:hypothetical protein
VLDLLRGRDDRGILHFRIHVLLENLLGFLEEALHTLALLPHRLLAEFVEHILELNGLVLGDFQVLLERRAERAGIGGADQPGHGLDDLVFRIVQVLQFLDEQFAQGLVLHVTLLLPNGLWLIVSGTLRTPLPRSAASWKRPFVPGTLRDNDGDTNPHGTGLARRAKLVR